MTRAAALALGLLVLSAAAPPEAGDDAARAWVPALPEARELTDRDRAQVTRAYGQASEAFGKRRYATALKHADKAFAIAPNASTALIRATVLERLDRPREAVEALLVARDLGPTEGEREAIEAALGAHGSALGLVWIEVRGAPAGVSVAIGDARVVGGGPRTVALPVGVHDATAEADGYRAARVALEARLDAAAAPLAAASGEASARVGPGAVVTFTLAEEVEAPSVVVAPPGEDAGGSALGGDGTGGGVDGRWVLIGGGLGVVAVGVVTHILAAGEASEADRWARPRDGVSESARRANYDAAVDAKGGLEAASWVLYGVGAAAAAVGVVLLALDGTPEAGRADVEVAPWAAPGAAGLTLDARF